MLDSQQFSWDEGAKVLTERRTGKTYTLGDEVTLAGGFVTVDEARISTAQAQINLPAPCRADDASYFFG